MGDFGIGDVVSAGIQYLGTRATNKTNKGIANKQMQFQKEMSNTAHQREVADLKAAGLNPALSATGGTGASSPVGASATMENPGEAINAYLESKRLNSDIEVNESQKDLNKAEKEYKEALTHLTDTQEQYVGYEPRTISQSTDVKNMLGGVGTSNSKTEYHKLTPARERRRSGLNAKTNKKG